MFTVNREGPVVPTLRLLSPKPTAGWADLLLRHQRLSLFELCSRQGPTVSSTGL